MHEPEGGPSTSAPAAGLQAAAVAASEADDFIRRWRTRAEAQLLALDMVGQRWARWCRRGLPPAIRLVLPACNDPPCSLPGLAHLSALLPLALAHPCLAAAAPPCRTARCWTAAAGCCPPLWRPSRPPLRAASPCSWPPARPGRRPSRPWRLSAWRGRAWWPAAPGPASSCRVGGAGCWANASLEAATRWARVGCLLEACARPDLAQAPAGLTAYGRGGRLIAGGQLPMDVVRSAFEFSAEHDVPVCGFLGEECVTHKMHPELEELHHRWGRAGRGGGGARCCEMDGCEYVWVRSGGLPQSVRLCACECLCMFVCMFEGRNAQASKACSLRAASQGCCTSDGTAGTHAVRSPWFFSSAAALGAAGITSRWLRCSHWKRCWPGRRCASCCL